ncbi:protein SFI1, partial [Phenoliferia sp. Uapishka_3]
PPQKSALSSRRPISTSSPSAPHQSLVLLSEAEELADRFRRCTLLSRAWLRWVELYSYHITSRARVDRRVRICLLKPALERWKEGFEKKRVRGEMAAGFEKVRLGRLKARLFVGWEKKFEERVKERRQREREERLLGASVKVRGRHAAMLAREVLQHWYNLMLSTRATRFHRETLTGLALLRWKSQYSRRLAISSMADELALEHQSSLLSSVLNLWRNNTALLIRERELVGRVEEDMKRNWWRLWRKKT